MIRTIAIASAAAILLAGCIKAKDTGCHFDECAVVAPASEIATLEAYLASNNITATKHCSGAYYQVIEQGGGAAATGCSTVTASYGGFTTTNSTRFDTGTATFPLSDVIRGWTALIPKVNSGGYIRMFIPPSLGYGSRAVGPIPANSTLIFNVRVNSVQ